MKVVCTFFGHKDAPQSISVQLENVIIDLIENRSVDEFYWGSTEGYTIVMKLRRVFEGKKRRRFTGMAILTGR